MSTLMYKLSLAACAIVAFVSIGAGDPQSKEAEKKKNPFADAPPPSDSAAAAPADPAATPEKKGPPFADAPKNADAPKPPDRTWTVKSGDFAFTVAMKPGIPDPEQMTEVIITANSIPKTPHPRFGSRVPIEGANLIVELANPAGEVIGRFLAHPMPLASGKYGLHVTPKHDGLYTLGIRGSTGDGKAISADVKLPVKVWPLPSELQGTGDPSEKGGSRRPVKGS